MTVLLHLDQDRFDRVAPRLRDREGFSTAVPSKTLRLSQAWRLCLIVTNYPLAWDFGQPILIDSGRRTPSVVAASRIRFSPRPTTTDDRVMVAEPNVIEGLSLRELVDALPQGQRRDVLRVRGAAAVDLGPPVDEAVVEALLRLRPELGPFVAQMRRGTEEPIRGPVGEVLSLESDAVRSALAIAGIDSDVIRGWSQTREGGFLAGLAYEPREEVLLAYDAARLPGWEALPGERPDWTVFSDGIQHIRVGNVNATPLEHTLGVDLIYRHLGADTFVLVQYKRMRKDAKGEWFYRPDAQLRSELDRMRQVDRRSPSFQDPSPQTWRLYPRACLLKLVRPPGEFDPRSDRLLTGIYLPITYLDELLADDCTLTSRGARRLGYDTIDRYLTTSLFVALLRQGWIGSRGITTAALAVIVDAAVNAERSVVIAEEWGEPRGAERRR